MDKTKYNAILCGVKDKVRDKLIHTGIDDSLGAYTRSVIPQFKDVYPLNDLEIVEIGIINPYTCHGVLLEEAKVYDWKELYNFQITNKAVKDETEISHETDKQ